MNFALELVFIKQFIEFLREFKYVFAWTYKDLKGIPPKITQHRIELEPIVPLVHQTRYRLNINYVAIVKQDIDKLLIASFIKPVEEATWLSSIVVIPKKNGKLKICVDFRKFNATTKKNPYPFLFMLKLLTQLLGMRFIPF